MGLINPLINQVSLLFAEGTAIILDDPFWYFRNKERDMKIDNDF